MSKATGTSITPQDVVATLRRMRDEIDLLLAALAPEEVATGDLMGLNMGAAAFRVLTRSQRPMRAPDIWKRMVAHGYSSKNGDRANFRSVSWALTLRLRQFGDVEKVGHGLWKARVTDGAVEHAQ